MIITRQPDPELLCDVDEIEAAANVIRDELYRFLALDDPKSKLWKTVNGQATVHEFTEAERIAATQWALALVQAGMTATLITLLNRVGGEEQEAA
jgi:hypothetical protein